MNAGASPSLDSEVSPETLLAPVSKTRKRPRRPKIHARRDSTIEVSQAKADINITPLVDVVLVLLIIFMVVTPMLHRGVDLDLPFTRHHLKRQDTGEQIVVSVRGDGIYVESDRVEVGHLASVLDKQLKAGGRPVNVRAERSLKFAEVRKVLEQIHAAGAPAVNMETQEHEE